MLTNKDRQQLIQDMKLVFPSKEELDQKILPINKKLNLISINVRQIKKDINSALKYTDEEVRPLKKRVV